MWCKNNCGFALLNFACLILEYTQINVFMLCTNLMHISHFMNYFANKITCCLYLFYTIKMILSVQFSSVTQSCLTICNPLIYSTPCLPVHHQLPEFTQTHVHWLGDAIQPSHLLPSPSPPDFTYWFTYCWSLAWRILSITLLECEMTAIMR